MLDMNALFVLHLNLSSFRVMIYAECCSVIPPYFTYIGHHNILYSKRTPGLNMVFYCTVLHSITYYRIRESAT